MVEGFDPAHVRDPRPDLVVIGNAVRSDNPEARAAIDDGIPYRSFSDALYELAIAQRHSVVVTGTHGKTTTTTLTAHLLNATGRDPSLLVGGISLDFGGSFREGDGAHFVVEGDEYDTAFFDKTPKFLHYHPKTLIVTSVEFDHADIYEDLDAIKAQFRQLVAGMPAAGILVAAAAHDGVRDVVADAPCRVVRYGVGVGGSVDALELAGERPHPGRRRLDVPAPCRGFRRRVGSHAALRDFNVENCLAALATVVSLGVPLADAVEGLTTFQGIKRRQEVRGEVAGVTVIDDFAHHPTAVRGTVEAVRRRFPGRRLIAVFEPRTNTSRRKIFQDDYARAFDDAGRVVIRAVGDEPIYSATGEVTERFSAEELAHSLSERGLATDVYEDVEAIVADLVQSRQEGDVVLVMSNGAFGNIWEKLLDALEKGHGCVNRR